MCGIIGYVGKKAASPILLEGLRRLEYRGYDSAGVAVLDHATLSLRKKKGKIDEGIARVLKWGDRRDSHPDLLVHSQKL